MLQEGGLYPGCGRSSCCASSPRTTTTPTTPSDCSTSSGCATRSRTPVRRLSGGQAQRLSLACALDRPARGRVPRRADRGHGPARPRHHLAARARPARRAASTVLLTTHAMDEAEHALRPRRDHRPAAGSPRSARRPSSRARGGDEICVRGRRRARRRRARQGARARPAAPRAEDRGRASTSCAPTATPARIADLACFLRDRDVDAHRAAVRPAHARRGLPPDHRRSDREPAARRRTRGRRRR